MRNRKDDTKTEILNEVNIPEMVQPKRKKRGFSFREIDPKDPMVIILVILLIFLTAGTALGSLASGGRKVIELDAAYGGENTGCKGIVQESEATQKIVDQLADLLIKDGHYQVQLTHASGTSASVTERAAKINKDKPDIVLSVHAGGSPDATKTGQFVYADIPDHKGHEDSLKLADFITKAFTSGKWKPQTGYLYYQPYDKNTYQILQVKEDDTKNYKLETWELMEKTDVPVVVSDQFFVTNQSDTDTWANEKGYRKAAENYYKAIRDYYGSEK